jgi:hypothetical protein
MTRYFIVLRVAWQRIIRLDILEKTIPTIPMPGNEYVYIAAKNIIPIIRKGNIVLAIVRN